MSKKTIDIVRSAVVPIPFTCERCGARADGLVSGDGVEALTEGDAEAGVGAVFAAERRARADGERHARAIADLAPCPKCGRRSRSSLARLWKQCALAVLVALTVPVLLTIGLRHVSRVNGSILLPIFIGPAMLLHQVGLFRASGRIRFRARAAAAPEVPWEETSSSAGGGSITFLGIDQDEMDRREIGEPNDRNWSRVLRSGCLSLLVVFAGLSLAMGHRGAFLSYAGILLLVALRPWRTREPHPDLVDTFTLTVSNSSLSLGRPSASRVVSLTDVDHVIGARRLVAVDRSGNQTRLACCLPSYDHAALAVRLTALLGKARADTPA